MKLVRGYEVCSNEACFISHMVQMKHEKVLQFKKTVDAFISHMVQMKQKISWLISQYKSSLYPTWFRWNPKTLEEIFYG